MISKQDILDRAAEWNLRPEIVEKDYVLGWLLASVSKHKEAGAHWVFKGGTCLKKCFFETYRFSEDLDFSLLGEARYTQADLGEILREVAKTASGDSGVDFPVDQVGVKPRKNKQGLETFEAKIHYQGPLRFSGPPKVSFDITKHEATFPPFARQKIFHAYPDAAGIAVDVQAYSFEELFAEKLRALVERTRPRDLYDVVHILENRPDCVEASRTRELFSAKCASKNFDAPRSAALLKLIRESEELRADWKAMLEHQLPQLPPIESILDRIDHLFDWLDAGSEVFIEPAVPLVAVAPRPGERQIESPRALSYTSSSVETLRFAGANRLVVEFDYDGKDRRVEPYSLRRAETGNTLLYAFEFASEHVKAFDLAKIRGMSVTKSVFVPRYQVELRPGGPIVRGVPPRRPSIRPKRVRAYSTGRKYIYRCSLCGRLFRKSTSDGTLRKHKARNASYDCGGRTGFFVAYR